MAFGVKIVMKYATAGFVIYGVRMDQSSYETMKIGICRGGGFKIFTDI